MRSSLRDLLGDLPTTGDRDRQISLFDDLDQQSGRQLGGAGGGASGIRLRVLDNEDDYYARCRGGRRGPPPELDLKMCAEVLGTESGECMVDFSQWTAADNGDESRSRISSSASLIRTESLKLKQERAMMTELMKELPRMLPLLSTIGQYGRPRFNRRTTRDGRLVISYSSDSDRKEEETDLGKMLPLLSMLDGFGRPRFVWKRATMSDERLVISMEQSVELDEEEKDDPMKQSAELDEEEKDDPPEEEEVQG